MPRIYISHRPEDSSRNEVLIIRQHLSDAFGADNILESTGSNIEIITQLERLVESCDVVLIVIGRYWLNMIDEEGMRLLDDRFDPIRVEIETALRVAKPIKVLLTDGSQLPQKENFPKTLQPLSDQKTLILSDSVALELVIRQLITEVKRNRIRYLLAPKLTEASEVAQGKISHWMREWSPDIKVFLLIVGALLGMLVIAYFTSDYVVSNTR